MAISSVLSSANSLMASGQNLALSAVQGVAKNGPNAPDLANLALANVQVQMATKIAASAAEVTSAAIDMLV